jgi:hypothetical protein
MSRRNKLGKIKNLVVISDTHCASDVALSHGHRLDAGGWYKPSPLQRKLWRLWENFWDWTYDHLGGEPFVLVHNGDVIDGNHHGITALSTSNLTTQIMIAQDALEPHVSRARASGGAYYQIRGTEAHVGASAREEEVLACLLGAERDPETGTFSRWELYMKFCGELIHFAHHIGTTSSTAYESSAPMREVVAAFVESGQWGMRPPSLIVRSHRHRFIKVEPPNCCIVVTPAWQAKTPLVYRIDRMRGPMFGGILIRGGEEGVEVKERIYTLKMTESVAV